MEYKYELIDFFDSPDIAEFNRNTAFTPAEQAVLISLSNKRTVKEKIDALKWLVDNYSAEDFNIDGIGCNTYCDRDEIEFKDIINDTIYLWEEALKDRYKNDGVVFATCLFEKGFERYSTVQEFRFFSNYDTAYKYLKNIKQEYLNDEDLKYVETHGVIYRIKLDSSDKYSDFDGYLFNNELDLVQIYANASRYKAEFESLSSAFYVHVPLPFKQGDIVKTESPFYKTYYGVIAYDLPDRAHDRNLQHRSADLTDMVVSLDVYSVETKEWESTDDTWCLHLAYCKDEELPEEEKILKLHSKDIRKKETNT